MTVSPSPTTADLDFVVSVQAEPVGTTLEGLASVRSLSIRGKAVGDAEMVHVRGLSNLRELDLCSTVIGDAGLASRPRNSTATLSRATHGKPSRGRDLPHEFQNSVIQPPSRHVEEVVVVGFGDPERGD